jgi:uncharacterized protein YcsI (UPF0317 family)
LAQTLGADLPAGSVSPHTGGPLDSYQGEVGALETGGVAGYLQNLRNDNPTQWEAAQRGDPEALQFFRDQITTFQDAAGTALYKGELFTNYPGTLTADETNAVNEQFFANAQIPGGLTNYLNSTSTAPFTALDPNDQPWLPGFEIPTFTQPQIIYTPAEVVPTEQEGFTPVVATPQPLITVPGESLPTIESYPAGPVFGPTVLAQQGPPVIDDQPIGGFNLGDVLIGIVSVPIALGVGLIAGLGGLARLGAGALGIGAATSPAYANPESPAESLPPQSIIDQEFNAIDQANNQPTTQTIFDLGSKAFDQSTPQNVAFDNAPPGATYGSGIDNPGSADQPAAFLPDPANFVDPNSVVQFGTAGWPDNGLPDQAGDTAIAQLPDLPQVSIPDEGATLGGGDIGAPQPPPAVPAPPDVPPPADPQPDQYGQYGPAGYYSGYPVVLDLSGKGIKITPRGSSNHFFDMTGDGYQNRTAWAGPGNGVLVFDPTGSHKITSPMQFEFTRWDPTAKSDMQALEDVFDTNHDGKLDASDAAWNDFGVLVTNADGTTTFETLAQLGITSIDLTTDNTDDVLSDGSKIVGETTYTKSDGTTGAAADVSFAYDANGYATQQTTAANADGSTSIDVKAFNPDGSLANETISTTSADGLSVTLQYDHTGDGIFDQTQTDVTVNNPDGSQTETISNFDVSGALRNRTATTTSGDGKTVTISRDLTGSGIVGQTETHVTAADGSTVITVSDLNPDGSLKDQTVATVSADGLTKSVQSDSTGDGIFDHSQTDVIVVNADASRTETVTDLNADGSIRDRSVTVTSADGSTKTIATDLSGDGVIDLTQVSTIVANADGSTVTTQKDLNHDGSLRDETVTTLSADGLSKTTQTDFDGGGTFNLTTTDVIVDNADGSQTETVTDTNADGSLRDQTTTVRGADGRSRTISADSTGNGNFDHVETIVVAADGSSVDTVTDTNADGSLKDQTVTTTSANGLSITTQSDTTGNGAFDHTHSDVTVVNADGSRTRTVTDTSQNGTLEDQTVTTTSANGLSITTQSDTTGDGAFDNTRTDVTVLNADGSKTETVSDFHQDGSLRDQAVMSTSANRLTVSVAIDANGDGATTQTQTSVTDADGSVVRTVSDFNPDGSLKDRTVTTTSADGLSVTTQVDATGAGTFNATRTDVTVLNADGSRAETASDLNADGSLKDRMVTTTSANGLSVTTQLDRTGAGTFDATRTDVTVLNGDGSRTETVSDLNADGSLKDRTVVTTSANGLSTTTQLDVDGAGIFEATRTDVTVLNADGSRTETVTDLAANGALVDRMVTTTSANARNVTIAADTTGAGFVDQTETIVIAADGSRVDTMSDLGATGALLDRTVTTTSADGLSTTIQRDFTGAGAIDQTDTDVTVLNPDGSRTETVDCFNGDGSLAYRIVTAISANGQSKETQFDDTGSGTFNLTQTDVAALDPDGSTVETLTHLNADGSLHDRIITTTSADRKTVTVARTQNGENSTAVRQTNADGSVTVTTTDLNADGSLKDRSVTTTSADGLSTTTQRDTTGAGSFNATRSDVTVLNADGSRTRTVTDFNASGSATDQTVTTTSANGLSTTAQYDLGGAGTVRETKTDVTAINADGSKTETITYAGAGGSLISQYAQTTSADGLSVTKQWDTTGNGTFDQTSTDVNVVNPDGSVTETVTARRADGSLISQMVTTTSADGLAVTAQSVTSGNPALDRIETVTAARNANGSSTQTLTDYNDDGSVKDKVITTTSADGRTVTIAREANGSGIVNQTETDLTQVDGSKVQTITDFNADGSVKDRTVVTTGADGLTTTTQWDVDGNGTVDRTRSDVTVVDLDGSRTETITDRNSDGSLAREIILATSADGRTKTLEEDSTGAGFFDRTETTTIAADGSSVTDAKHVSAAGALLDETVTSVSADNLSKTVLTDSTGNGVFDEQAVTRVNIDGSETTTAEEFNADGSVKSRTITTLGADGKVQTIETDSTNAGRFDSSQTVVSEVDGSTQTTLLDLNADGSVKDRTVTTVSADGLVETIDKDSTNAGRFDSVETILLALDGSAQATTFDVNADGSVKDETLASISADGKSEIVTTDKGGTWQFIIVGDGHSMAPAPTYTTVEVDGDSNAVVIGNGNDDVAVFGTGNTITLGTGNDALLVGAGRNTFALNSDPGVTMITDFQPGSGGGDVGFVRTQESSILFTYSGQLGGIWTNKGEVIFGWDASAGAPTRYVAINALTGETAVTMGQSPVYFAPSASIITASSATSMTVNYTDANGNPFTSQLLFNPDAATLEKTLTYAGNTTAGTLTSEIINPTAGGSRAVFFNPNATTSEETLYFTGSGETGTLTSAYENEVNGQLFAFSRTAPIPWTESMWPGHQGLLQEKNGTSADVAPGYLVSITPTSDGLPVLTFFDAHTQMDGTITIAADGTTTLKDFLLDKVLAPGTQVNIGPGGVSFGPLIRSSGSGDTGGSGGDNGGGDNGGGDNGGSTGGDGGGDGDGDGGDGGGDFSTGLLVPVPGTNDSDPGDHPPDDPEAPFAMDHPAPPDPRDPLVLDLAGVGIKLSSVTQSSAHFDFTGSGFATKTGWITQGEGLLVINAQPNAPLTINQLLGAQSGDGFADLAALDTDGDGVINASDPAFANLSVWVDANGNGQLDPGELVSLSSLGITSISVSTTPSGQTINGNTIVSTSTFQMTGSNGPVTNTIAEVDLATNALESLFTPPAGFAFNSAAFALPQLVGYGTVPDLWVAMSLDPQLLADAQNLVVNAGSMSAAQFSAAFQAMVWEWVGASNVDPNSRGTFIDARHLAVDYAFYGIDQATEPVYQINPNWHSGPQWETIYQSIIAELEVRFVGQLAADQLFNSVAPASVAASWFMPFTAIQIDLRNDTVTVNFDQLIQAIVQSAPSDPTAAAKYYQQTMSIVQNLRVDLFGESSEAVTAACLAAAGALGCGTDIQASLLAGLGAGLVDEGANAGPLATTLANGAVFLGTGDKTITGGSNDIYVYTPAGGNDTINDGGTAAALVLSGLNRGDVTIERSGPNPVTLSVEANVQDLVIINNATGATLTVANEFQSNAVTSIVFADGTVYDQSQIGVSAPIRGIPGQTSGYDTSGDVSARYDLGSGDYGTVSAFHDGTVRVAWGAGDGNQAFTIEGNNYQNSGSLVLGGVTPGDVTPADVSFYRSGPNFTDLTIANKATGKTLTLYNEFANSWQGVASATFGDGTAWQYANIVANTYITAASSTSGSYDTNSLNGTINYDLGTGTFGNVSAFHDQAVVLTWGAGDSNETFTIEGNFFQNSGSLLLGTLNPTDVSFYRSGVSLTDLTIRNNATGNTLTIANEFKNAWQGVASITFGNGTVWQASAIAANTDITAASSASGSYDTNSLSGTIIYDLGTGTFGNVSAFHDQAVEVVWDAGDSSEAFTIEGNNFQNSGSVVLENLNPADVSFYRSGASLTDLTIRDNATGNTLTLSNEFSNPWQGVASVTFGNGTVWQASAIAANTYITAASGSYNTASLNGTIIYDLGTGTFGNVSAFHDQAAEVIWGPGDSNQAFTIEGNNFQNSGSLLLAGLNPADVSFYRSGSNLVDLIVQNKTTGNTLTISNQFANAWQGVASVTFANGTVWNQAQIASNVPNLMTTPTNTSNLPNLTYDLGAGDYGNVTAFHDDPLTIEWGAGNGNQIFTIESNNFTNDATAVFFGLNPTDVTLIRSGSSFSNLTVVNNSTGKALTLDNQFSGNAWQGVNAVHFANGTTWSQSQITVNTYITAASSQNGVFDTSSAAGIVNYDLGAGNFGNVSAFHDPTVDVFWAAGDGNQAFTIEGNNFQNSGSVILKNLDLADVSFYRSGSSFDDLTIRNKTTGSTLAIRNEFNNPWQGVASVTFGDGTVWQASTIAVNSDITAASSTSGSYDTSGLSGMIVYDLGTGTFGNVSAFHDQAVEVLWGAADSSQTFTIEGNNFLNSGAAVLAGLNPSAVSVYRSGSSFGDLTVRNNASGNTLTIRNEFNNPWQGVASVTFGNGTVWQASSIAANSDITAASSTSGSYNTSGLSGTTIYDLGTGTFGNVSAFHDQAVEVIWGPGDSNQAFTIEGNNFKNCGSVLLKNLRPTDVSLSRSGSNLADLSIQSKTTGNALTISNEFANPWQGAASVTFGDGTVWLIGNAQGTTLDASAQPGATAAYFRDNVTVNLAAGTANVNGSSTSDTLIGIHAAIVAGANDTLIGDNSGDTLSATGSNDTVHGGTGNDTLVINGGTDTFFGGGGNDTFEVLSAAVTAGLNQPQNLIADFNPSNPNEKIDLRHVSGVASFADLSFNTVASGGQSYLQVGLGNSGQAITLAGVTAAQLSASNFLFVVVPPALTVQNASGSEDQPIGLAISPSETDPNASLSLTIGGIPSDAILSNSQGALSFTNGGISFTSAQLAAGALAGLAITPTSADEPSFVLNVTATATDGGSTASTSQNINVTVSPNADAPSLTAPNASGTEGQPIALALGAALAESGPADPDASLSLAISGIPAGASLSNGQGALTFSNGSITFTAAQLASGALNGLAITPASDANFALTVTATTQDGASVASTSATAQVTVGPLAPTVTVSGTAQEGQTLTAVASTGDGDVTLGYQWQSSSDGQTWSNISGATGSTYTAQESDEGFFLRVSATATDSQGNSTSAASTATSAVIDITPTLSVTVSGTAHEGQTLTANAVANDSDAVVTYQWQTFTGNAWSNIAGATGSTYTAAEADEGHQLRVIATSTDSDGSGTSATSAATAAVVDITATLSVTVSGTAQEGQSLTANATTNDADAVVTYQWQSLSGSTWSNISGATGSIYTPAEADEGHQLRAVATSTDSDGSGTTATSAATAAIVDITPSLSVTVSGTAQEGQSLTANATANDADAVVTYQWQSLSGSTWSNISGATGSTYTPAETDEGHQLRVVATSTDSDGSGTMATSAATGAVVDITPSLSVTISGTAQEGQTLTANAGANDSDAVVNYQWQSLTGSTWSNISGAVGSTYTAAEADEGYQLRVVATSTDSDGSGTTAASAATAAVVDITPTLSVTVSGTAQEGQTLTANAAANDADASVTYQWQSLTGSTWSNISGAVGSTYTAAEADEGTQLRVVATSTDSDGSGASATSAATAAVVDITPTLSVTVSGTAQEGQTLTANAVGNDSDAVVTYQWQSFNGATWSNISGATASTYTAVEADEGNQLRVIATSTDSDGSGASATSAATAAVVDIAPALSVTVSGTAQEGQTLTANATANDADAVVAYQWQSLTGSTWSNISGATGSAYTAAEADEGHQLRVVATSTDSDGSGTTATSAATAAVVDITPALSVTISGTAQEGQTLTATAVANDADAIVAYQWQSLTGSTWSNISGATAATYMAAEADEGHQLHVVATSTDSDGSGTSATSAATAAVVDITPTLSVTISGAAQEGQTLTANATANDADAVVAYQWQSLSGPTWSNIPGATAATYTAAEADEGHQLRAVATSTDSDGGGTTATSAATVAVVDITPTLSVSVSGTAQEGQTLTANAVANDSDAVVTYQWQSLSGSTWSNISGATSSTFLVAEANEGHELRVIATSTDSDGSGTTATSTATAAVVDIAPTLSVTVSGTAQEGKTLTASAVANDADAVVTYQWQSLSGSTWSNISGATSSTYTAAEVDEGHQLRVVATSSDSDGSGTSVTSAATAAVVDVTPTLTVSVSGTAQEGKTLTATAQATSDADGGTTTYQWQSLTGSTWSNISGATASTYTAAEADQGHQLRVSATFVDDTGQSVTAASSATAAVIDIAPTLSVTISGTAREGQTLTANAVANDADAVIAYQWQSLSGSTWSNISGATSSTFLVGEANETHELRVIATSSDSDGSGTSATSAATAAVTDIAPTLSVTVSGTAQEAQTLTATATANDSDATIKFQWQSLSGSTWSNISGATASTYKIAESNEGHQLRVVATSTDTDGSGTSANSAATAAVTDAPPTLTISNHSITVAAGGSVALPITEATSDSDDTLTLTVAGLTSYETITDKHDSTVFSGSSVTLTSAEVSSGLTLHSNYAGTGHPVNTLTVTANNTTSGEAVSSASQTITVTDPPPSSTSPTADVLWSASGGTDTSGSSWMDAGPTSSGAATDAAPAPSTDAVLWRSNDPAASSAAGSAGAGIVWDSPGNQSGLGVIGRTAGSPSSSGATAWWPGGLGSGPDWPLAQTPGQPTNAVLWRGIDPAGSAFAGAPSAQAPASLYRSMPDAIGGAGVAGGIEQMRGAAPYQHPMLGIG